MVSEFPGGVGISNLHVYDWPAADGLHGGSPHVHLACAEAYVVIEGEGRVQTLTMGGFAETPLAPGAVVWFTPGTIHRLVNERALRIVVIMQNGGLPEAGDAVLTFPPEVLADAEGYAAAAASADGVHVHTAGERSARHRRDLAVDGFLELRRRTEAGDRSALEDFYRAAVRLKSGRFDDWERLWRGRALATAEHTGHRLSALRNTDLSPLCAAEVHHSGAPAAADRRFGMCGRLDVYDL